MEWTFVDGCLFVLAVIDLVVATVVTVDVVLRKRDPRAAIGWVALVWLSPIIGSLLYLGLGINRIKRKATSLELQDQWHHPRYVPRTEAEEAEVREFERAFPAFADFSVLVERLTERAELPGNAVRPLRDGDQAYPAMLEAIDGAKRSISLMSYIFDNDRAGQAFVERLAAAKKRGIEIRVLVDDVGSRYSRPTILGPLRSAEIPARTFLPTRVRRLFKYANLRNHRKILVVDGCVGFTGGTNIREGHCLELNPGFPVRCLHFQIEGPVAAHLQETFAIDWAFATGESLDGELWFPDVPRAGHVWARGISGGPDEDLGKLQLTILGALGAARHTAFVVTPYFLPDHPIMLALNAAALRGVDVRILLPSKNNMPMVHWASQTMMPYLLDQGCRIYLAPPPFDHAKLLVIDKIWSLVGSANWDPRSLRLNFEFNVECFCADLGSQLDEFVRERLVVSHELSADELRGRRFASRVRDGFARLLAPYL